MKTILYISNSAPNKLNSILDAMKDMNFKIDEIYKDKEYKTSYHKKSTLKDKILFKFGYPSDNGLNDRVVKQVEIKSYDIVFIVKGNAIYPKTLKYIKKKLPNTKLISWSLDDMYAKHNRSSFYTKGISLYDLVVTTKSYNLDQNELPSLGAKNILFLYQAFDKNIHKPCLNCKDVEKKHDVVFIGYAEKVRFDYMNYLAEKGINIHLYGAGWNKKEFQVHSDNLHLHFENLLNENYSNTLSCSKIALCFLRKINRDLHTSRSIEIPACRTLMIAERTTEHLNIFKEDKEAVFFDSKEELFEKVKYYLNYDIKRDEIAYGGYEKVINLDYTYHNMVRKILGYFD